MNQLSWLLYWADVLPSFGNGLMFVSIVSSVLSGIALFVYIMMVVIGQSDAYDAESAAAGAVKLRAFRWIFPLCLLLGLGSNLIPSKETFYLIAGSEMGEKAIQTPEFQKVRALVNDYLDKQLKEVNGNGETQATEEITNG